MERTLGTIGSVIGGLGVVICAVAGIGRIAGNYHMFGFEAETLFLGGIALIAAGCLGKLHEIAAR